MKNGHKWSPTKFEPTGSGGWEPSTNAKYLSPSSWIAADAAVAAYQRLISTYAHGRLLDFGCGLAPLYGAYRERVTEAVCADWSDADTPSPYLDVEADLSGDLPLESNSFDTVLATDILEHLPNTRKSVAELYRILKSGGVLIGGVPYMYWLHSHPHDYFRFTSYALELLFEQAGFEVLEVQPMAGGVEAVADMLAKFAALAPQGAPEISACLKALGDFNSTLGVDQVSTLLLYFPLSYSFALRKPI